MKSGSGWGKGKGWGPLGPGPGGWDPSAWMAKMIVSNLSKISCWFLSLCCFSLPRSEASAAIFSLTTLPISSNLRSLTTLSSNIKSTWGPADSTLNLHQLRMMVKRWGQESMKKAPDSSLIPPPSARLANFEAGSALRMLELAKKIFPPTFSFTRLSSFSAMISFAVS